MLGSTISRLAAFGAALAIVGGAAAGVGALTRAAPPGQDCLKVAAADAGFAAAKMPGGGHGEAMREVVPGSNGLHSSLAGLELVPQAGSLPTGVPATWRFQVVACDGRAVHRFDREQGKLLHLIVARTDLTGYQHLHPRLGRDGTFSVELSLAHPGTYRAIADFVLDGRKYVLGTALSARGDAHMQPLAPAGVRAQTDGYEVELQRPAELKAGEQAQLTFRITRDGRAVTDLEPYLGAYGHLVALHAGDLAYSHVHPAGTDRAGGLITFNAELEDRGPHRLFLQFQTAGRVHTAAFTQNVS